MSAGPGLRSRPLLLALLGLTIVWLWLSGALTVVAAGEARHDDALFVRQAVHLVNGEWLGPYDELTLAKGAGYPLFLAACSGLGVSVPLGQRLLWIGACLVALRALAPLLTSRTAAFAAYAALLLQPVAWRNLVREAIYPALSLLVVALALALLLRPEAAPEKVGRGAGLLGLALGAFWITREEGVWLVPPLLLGAAALGVSWALRFGVGRELGRRLLALGVAPAAFAGPLLLVSLANRIAYGTGARVETVAEPFTRAYGALARIRAGAKVPFVPVSRAAREAAYAVSPAFRELKGDLEGSLGAQWRGYGCGTFAAGCADIAGGWFQWALRAAVAKAGHHGSATAAAGYYARVAAEIDAACDAGRLPCGPPRATLSPVDLPDALRTIARRPAGAAAAAVGTLRDFRSIVGERWSTGTPEQIAPFAEVAASRVAPALRGDSTVVRGWAVSESLGGVDLELESEGKTVPRVTVERMASPDLVAHLGSPAVASARFEVKGPCPDPCVLVLRSGGAVVARTPLSGPGGLPPETAPGVKGWIDEVIVPTSRNRGPFERLDGFRRAVLARAADAVRVVLPPAAIAAAAFAVAALVLALHRRRSVLPLVAAAVPAAAAAARVVLVSAVHLTSFPAVGLGYLAPAFPLATLAVLVAFLAAAKLPGRAAAAAIPGRTVRPSA